MDNGGISEKRRLASNAGQTSLELLNLIFNAVPNGIVVVSSDGIIQLANPAVFSLFGWEPADLVGRPIETLLPDQLESIHREHRASYVAAPTSRPMGHGRLLHGQRRDGSRFLTEVALSPIQVDGELQVIAVVRDITERVDAEEVARHERALKAVSDDRMRIARDLHDAVIQNLFAAGLTIANISSTVDRAAAETLEKVVEMLDESIRHLRGAVFELHARGDGKGELQKIVVESERVLGFRPTLTIEGDVDGLPAALRDDAASVVRESLSNVAKHAQAASVKVSVTVGDLLTIRVSDDGVGIGDSANPAGTGTRSLRERAANRGGDVRYQETPGGGTTVVWWVHIASED